MTFEFIKTVMNYFALTLVNVMCLALSVTPKVES